MIVNSWINPQIAEDPLVTLAMVLLASLLLLPLVFAVILYYGMGLISRINALRHRGQIKHEAADES
jgi:hypothetical protein